ncbi:MAG: hypothetical protein ABSC65_27730 [Acidobacteriaceae bacterium]|jgi:hypothetical protein
MKKYTRILVATTFLLGLGVAANAEIQPVIAVTMPFEFVAGKTTLPAGKYIVKRISDQPFDVLMITSYDRGTSVLVNPVAMDNASTYKPTVKFNIVEDRHYLSGIQTADYVYNFRVSRPVTLAATAKPHDTVSVSVSAGGH